MRTVYNAGTTPDLSIQAIDEPGHGGANHEYTIETRSEIGSHTRFNGLCAISFQNGPVQEHGINGVSESALLAVVLDRLQSFQKGDFSCRENALALTKIEEAIHWMNARTRDRESRGVEGTSTR